MNKKDLKIINNFKEKVKKGEAFYSKENHSPETYSELLKNKIIANMIKRKRELALTNKEFSKILGMTESQVSKMLAYHVEHFTLDFLMDKVQTLDIHMNQDSRDILRIA